MTSLIVLSHPNHELAIFGYLQKMRPHLLYLTDGGGEVRKEETRRGLRSIGLLDRASFMDHTESEFYDALIKCDSKFFFTVAEEVRPRIESLSPDEILCDAVEFYNPVHDMSLPIVRAALRGRSSPPVFEVPLIYQAQDEVGTYVVQRARVSQAAGQIEFQLSDAELAGKVRARDQIYTLLSTQLGDVISGLDAAHLQSEVIFPARLSVPKPESHDVLRYERRAETLAAAGEIKHKITYDRNYLSVAKSLIEGTQYAA